MHTRLIAGNRAIEHHRGMTLLEVMIALVIMSVGLLGLASLQITGINNNSNSENRTESALIANDLVERMRANPLAVQAGDYAAIDYAGIDCAAAPAKSCEDRASAAEICSTQETAAFDAYMATCNARNITSSASIAVQCTDNTGLIIQPCGMNPFRTVTVNWINRTDDGTDNKSLRMVFQP